MGGPIPTSHREAVRCSTRASPIDGVKNGETYAAYDARRRTQDENGFRGFGCSGVCEGHEAGYRWAQGQGESRALEIAVVRAGNFSKAVRRTLSRGRRRPPKSLRNDSDPVCRSVKGRSHPKLLSMPSHLPQPTCTLVLVVLISFR